MPAMLKRSSLLALLLPLSLGASENSLTGLWRLDIDWPSQQEGATGVSIPRTEEIPQHILVSRARLHWKSQLTEDLVSHFRVQRPEYANAQLGLVMTNPQAARFSDYLVSALDQPLSAEIALAYLDYRWSETFQIRGGQIPITAVSASQMGYHSAMGDTFWQRSAGTVFTTPGQNMGAGITASVGPIYWDFSAWQQSKVQRLWDLPAYSDAITQGSGATTLAAFSDLIAGTTHGIELDNFRSKDITTSYATRLGLIYHTRPQTQWSLGVGYRHTQLDIPIALACVGAYDQGAHIAPHYSMAMFNRLNELGFDATRVYKNWLFQVGYQGQQLRLEASRSYYDFVTDGAEAVDAQSTAQGTVWNNDGRSHAWWAHLGYLFWGAEYEMDETTGAVAGIKPHPHEGSLEIYSRIGTIRRNNVLALLTESGWQDISTQDQARPMTSNTPSLAEIRTVDMDEGKQYLLLTTDNTGSQSDTTLLVNRHQQCYRTDETSYVFGLSYALSERTMFKAEYQLTHRDFIKGTNIVWQESWHGRFESLFRVRWESAL